VEKIILERSHKGKKHIFSFIFLQNLFDYFLRLNFFLSVNLCSLKVLNFRLKIFSYVFFFALYNLYTLCSFLGLWHISLGFFLLGFV